MMSTSRNRSLSTYNTDVAESDTDTYNSQAGFQKKEFYPFIALKYERDFTTDNLVDAKILINGSVSNLKFTDRVAELNIKLQI